MRLAISEILEEASNGWGKKKKIAKLHEHSSPQLKTVLDYTFNPLIVWLLPTDVVYKPSDDNLAGLRTRLYTEAPGLNRFINIGPYPNLELKKRVALFTTLLETIHPKDAEMLVHIVKNRILPYEKLSKEIVAEAFPILSKNWGVTKESE